MFVIWNPTAGGGRAARRWEILASELSVDGIAFEARPTTRPGEATEIAAHAIAAGHRLLGACGGDGTLHEVVQGVVGRSDVTVAFLPTGSSCDFAKCFPARPFPQRQPRLVDLIRIQGHGPTRYAVNYASIGLMAEATKRFNEGFARRISVDVGVILATARTLVSLRTTECTLAIDGEEPAIHRLMNLTLFKTPNVGGGMHFAGVSIEPGDGRMMVAALRPATKAALFGIIPALYRGDVLERRDVWSRSCERIDLRTSTPATLEADGEIIGRTPAEFQVMRRALRVLV
jgi:diacylglycerol kinase (ATP)